MAAVVAAATLSAEAEVVSAAALSAVEDIAVARRVVIVAGMAGTVDIAAATAATVMDVATAGAMADGASDSDLDSAIPTTAAITAIRMPMDIHITAAAIMRPLLTIPMRMAPILTAMRLLSSISSINTDRRSSNSSTVRNMDRSMAPNTARSQISAKAIRRLRRLMASSKTPRQRRRLERSRKPTTTSPMGSGIVSAILSSAHVNTRL